MDDLNIIDESGINVLVSGIYYISNNNYYFIYTKGQIDENNHVILYITKVLREVINKEGVQIPTGYLIGVKIDNEDEYNIVKQDIINIIDEKKGHKDLIVRYLDVGMLKSFKVRDYRTFKLDKKLYDAVFNNTLTDTDYKDKYEQEVNKNKMLQEQIEKLQEQIERIKEILN